VRESKTRPVMRSAKEKNPASFTLTGLLTAGVTMTDRDQRNSMI
jgi:hypothetical protein